LDQRIGWAPDTFAASIQDVYVDHGRSHIDVAQQFLHRANACLCVARRQVVPVFKQVRKREGGAGLLAAGVYALMTVFG